MLVITSAWLRVFNSSVIICLPLFPSWISNIFKVLIAILTAHSSTVDVLRLAFSNNTTLRIVWLCVLISAVFGLMINSLSTSCVGLVVDSRMSHLIICLKCLLTSNLIIRLLLLISDVANWVLVIVNYIRGIVRNNLNTKLIK